MRQRMFTTAEEREADRLAIRARELAADETRPIMYGTAVDARETKDRDDAFHIQVTDSQVIIEVTIADVAAIIPKDSPLDIAAQNRGFTLYRSYGRSPMVPFNLSEGDSSLTDEAIRPGFTYTITLNRQTGEVEDLRFGPSRIRADIRTYDGLGVDPDYAEWLRVGEWLSRNRQERGYLPFYDTDTGEVLDDEGETHKVRPSQLGAYRLVQEAMVLTNQTASEWAARAGIPYIFRNHGVRLAIDPDGRRHYRYDDVIEALERQGLPTNNLMGQVQVDRAQYENVNRGHFGTGAPGYSHLTSPIRRYVDLVNTRMLHYAYQQVATLVEWAAYYAPEQAREIETAVWQQSADLVRLVENARENPDAVGELRSALAAWVPDTGRPDSHNPVEALTETLLNNAPPYTHTDMQQIAGHINFLMAEERKERTVENSSEVQRWLGKVFPNTDDRIIDFNMESFSRLLRGAAETGKMSPRFYEEIRIRMQRHELLFPEDYAIILSRVEDKTDPDWRDLQERVLNDVRQVPVRAVRVYQRALELQGLHGELLEASIKATNGAVLSAAAVMVKNHEGECFSSPYFALGKAPETAEHRAYCQFLEQMSRGELLDVECVHFPPSLALKLPTMAEAATRLWEEMVATYKLTVEEIPKVRGSRHSMKLLLSGGPLSGEPLLIRGSGTTPEKAHEDAILHAMKHPVLARYISKLQGAQQYQQPVEIHALPPDGVTLFSRGEGDTPNNAVVPRQWVARALEAEPPCNGYQRV